MSIRQVFVIWTHPLFRESLSMLLNHPQIELVGETCNYATASRQIEALRPNTLLIEETEGDLSKDFIHDINEQPWDMRILFLNLRNNQLNFFHHEHRTVGRVEELVQVILSEMK